MVLHVIMVEVPIETGLALALQMGEELLLHLLQQVETHKDVSVVRKRFMVCCDRVATNSGNHLAVEGTLVG